MVYPVIVVFEALEVQRVFTYHETLSVLQIARLSQIYSVLSNVSYKFIACIVRFLVV